MTPDPKVDDIWVAVSARGRGEPVRIVQDNGHHVYFKAIGRGKDQSQKFKLARDVFKIRYAPIQQADERQKRLALEERTYPKTLPLGEASDPEPKPLPQWPEVLHRGEIVHYEQPEPHDKSAKLTDEQAREVVQLVQDGAGYQEVADIYGVSRQNVYDIMRGKSYRRAVSDLIPAFKTDTPPKPREVFRRFTESDVRLIKRRLAAGTTAADIARDFGVKTWLISSIEKGYSYRWVPGPEEEPVPQTPTPNGGASIPQPPIVPSKFATIVKEEPPAQRPDLVTDLADALELLLEYHGKPVPRFLVVNRDAVAAIIKEARSYAPTNGQA